MHTPELFFNVTTNSKSHAFCFFLLCSIANLVHTFNMPACLATIIANTVLRVPLFVSLAHYDSAQDNSGHVKIAI